MMYAAQPPMNVQFSNPILPRTRPLISWYRLDELLSLLLRDNPKHGASREFL